MKLFYGCIIFLIQLKLSSCSSVNCGNGGNYEMSPVNVNDISYWEDLIDFDGDASASNGSKNKRRKIAPEMPTISPAMSIEEIIELDVEYVSNFLNKTKLDHFRETLKIISRNDPNEFLQNWIKFKNTMGTYFTSFRIPKSGLNGEFCMFRYIIMFGSDDLFNLTSRKSITISEETNRISEAIKYLLETKPLHVLINIVSKYHSLFAQNGLFPLVLQCIKDKYPVLTFLKESILKIIDTEQLATFLPIFSEEDEAIAFDLLINLIISPDFKFKTLNCIASAVAKYPLLFKGLPVSKKYSYFNLVIGNDNAGVLESLINADSSMIPYFHIMTDTFTPLLYVAIEHQSYKCLRYILQHHPESVIESFSNPISALHKVAFNSNTTEMIYELFDSANFTFSTIYPHSIDFNLIPLTFLSKSLVGLRFYERKYGKRLVIEQISDHFKSKNEILLFCLNSNYDKYFTDYICHLFKINLNDEFIHNGMRGNAQVFIFGTELHSKKLVANLDYSQRIYSIQSY